ncbi:MAG: glycine--tRNA ligase subunit beta [Aquificota bacterium]|nr:glycine--tRNA ligase subunit beta [Aquificota bacterium]
MRSGRITYGHRFLSSGPIEVKRAEDYLRVLEENHVIPDVERRRRMILKEIEKIAGSVGGKPEYPEGLVEEVANLVEYPFPVMGCFEERFLELPEKVIVTVCAHHQRFFCVSKGGRITNHFIGISNNRPEGETIKRGYERVLKARLEDALFFYREDLKKKLDDLVPKLSGVLVHPKIGTVLDKVNRLKALCLRICDILKLPEETKSKVLRASHLSKADLLTEMVREFDELQGYMGYVYALKQGEDEEVALALRDQYRPSGPEDETPKTVTGAVLSLADRIDNLISFFSAGEIPKGGSDPYGLRRSAFGMFRILEERNWEVDIRAVLDLYGEVKNLDELEAFISQRLESYLGDQDLVRAVLSVRSPLNPTP